MSDGYSVADVCRLLGLSRSNVTKLVQSGLVRPERGARGEYRFGFPDLVVLRTAKSLLAAKVPSARVIRSLRRLRAKLPDTVPLTGLRIEAVGDNVVVSDGDTQWQPDDGQCVLRFSVQRASGGVAFFEPGPTAARAPVVDWFEQALSLENDDPAAACAAYRNALQANKTHLDAYINLGVCLQTGGNLDEAESVYRAGLANCGPDGLLLYNLAVLLEERERYDEALEAYRAAVAQSPEHADAHYNLALLCKQRGLVQEAVRHLSAYRRLKA